MESDVRYSIIIPVYNEEAVIHETRRRLTRVMESIGEPYELLFVNDGSQDRTGAIIDAFAKADERIRVLDFSRNFGHQIAITAGMDYARGDAVIIIDGDLQDPPELIPEMIEKWREGYEVVYAQRSERKGESGFKKVTAALFYRVLDKLSEVKMPVDTGDFRLIDRKVCDAMREVREKNRYVRGLISWVGFRQTSIQYVREERYAGRSKYPLGKMLHFSLDGITSFSYKPLKLALYMGLIITLASLVFLLGALGQKLLTANPGAGWAALIACLMMLNGIVLTFLGITGEYIGRIYDESRDRPLYILRNKRQVEKTRLKEVKWLVH